MKLRNILFSFFLVLLVVGLAFYIASLQKKIRKSKLIETNLEIQRDMQSNFITDLLPIYDAYLSKKNPSFYLNAQKSPSQDEKVKFCIVIPSYNNVSYTTQTLNSIFIQDYHNWRVIFMDDSSTDGMSELVEQIKNESKLPNDKFTVNRYKERMNQSSYSVYYAAHNFCKDDEVLVQFEGDDILSTPSILKKLAAVYEDKNVWVTYGHFINIPTGELCNIPKDDPLYKKPNNVRKNFYCSYIHLRTSYTWLFKKIKVEDLQFKGKFIYAAPDLATMCPMLEMAGQDRSKYINDITYLHRVHPNNVHINNRKEQIEVDAYIRKITPYKRLDKSPFDN